MKDVKKAIKSRRNFLNTSLKTGAMLPFIGSPFLASGLNSLASESFNEQEPLHPSRY